MFSIFVLQNLSSNSSELSFLSLNLVLKRAEMAPMQP